MITRLPMKKSSLIPRLKKLHSLPGYAELDLHEPAEKQHEFTHAWHQNKHTMPHSSCVLCAEGVEPIETIYQNKKQKFALKMCYLRTSYRNGTLSQEWVEALESVGFEFKRKYPDNWMPFEEARTFVRSLKLDGWHAWWAYCKSGKKPENIPANPVQSYKGEGEWRGANDWFNNGRRNARSMAGAWRPFKEARAFARTLGLKNQPEWAAYCKSEKKPVDIPACPNTVYENDGYTTLGDWLGYTPMRRGNWRPFKEARAFVHTLGLRSVMGWRKYCTSGDKPDDIPSNPQHSYKNEYRDSGDWLGQKLKKGRSR